MAVAIAVTLILVIIVYRYTRSTSYIVIAVLATVTGATAPLIADKMLVIGTSAVWAVIILSLLLGFGLSLLVEAIVLYKLHINCKVIGPVLIKANMLSYIFLLLVAPFVWQNPVEQIISYNSTAVRDLIVDGYPSEAIRAVEWQGMTTAQILGISFSIYKRINHNQISKSVVEQANGVFRIMQSGGFPGRTEAWNYNVYGNIRRYCEIVLTKPYIDETDKEQLEWIIQATGIWPRLIRSAINESVENFREAAEELIELEMQVFQKKDDYTHYSILYISNIPDNYKISDVMVLEIAAFLEEQDMK